MDQFPVVREAVRLPSDQFEQVQVAVPVAAEERAQRQPLLGAPAGDLAGRGRNRGTGRVRAAFEEVQERGDVFGRLREEQGLVVVVTALGRRGEEAQFGKLVAHAPQHRFGVLRRTWPDLLGQTPKEGIDIGPHGSNVPKGSHGCPSGDRRRPRGEQPGQVAQRPLPVQDAQRRAQGGQSPGSAALRPPGGL
ncbi:hypothetical protein [Streptomyces sp. JJ38]|uniref:hypothetical protein n=1 Tax=Streptomyces sp. JJ38 TaxID=2738128 RepID=UPI0027D80936|nr:hypothetical protein [Streptomyces sp. JJ38]